MQEANVNDMKGYPMLSSHAINKEVMFYNKWFPIEHLIISALYDYTATYEYHLGYYIGIVLLYMYLGLCGHITPPFLKWKAYVYILFLLKYYHYAGVSMEM